MNLLGNYAPAAIEKAKREVAEHYRKIGNGLMPEDFFEVYFMTNYIDINLLKKAVISIDDERSYMSKLVNDICFTIEVQYQRYYNLDENNFDLIS